MGFVTCTTKSGHSDMYNVFKILHIECKKKKEYLQLTMSHG